LTREGVQKLFFNNEPHEKIPLGALGVLGGSNEEELTAKDAKDAKGAFVVQQ